MKYRLLIRTVRHLKPIQIIYQVKNRIVKARYVTLKPPKDVSIMFRFLQLKTKPIVKYHSLEGEKFTFLNLEHKFEGWNFTGNGMLWAYNQNYFDWINQEEASYDKFQVSDFEQWIDRFISDVCGKEVVKCKMIGLDPYPIALRSINWVKFFSKYPASATNVRLESLYSQVKFLERKLEYHLLGNHLLEDACALFIAAVFFVDKRLYKKSAILLKEQLKEQILDDGAHYEQSPMYHCILLDRILDAINVVSSFGYQDSRLVEIKETTELLTAYAERMLGHLESVMWKDGSIPLLNDAAYGIAPTAKQIFDYAKRLGLSWKAIPMKECGYRKFFNEHMEAIVDIGNITAIYQAGHTHADTFNYELRIDGKPFVVDTGISTYDKTPRRQYERGTSAHNCVVVNGGDSSEIWGGFRVGRRCYSNITYSTKESIMAEHNGYKRSCRRLFEMKESSFIVEDWYDGRAVNYIHLVEDANMERILVEEAEETKIEENYYSTDYNILKKCKVMKITFNGHMKYTIR